MRGMISNCQIREIYNQCTCFPTPYNPLFTSLHSGYLPTYLPHMNDFLTCKPNGTMTSYDVKAYDRSGNKSYKFESVSRRAPKRKKHFSEGSIVDAL